MKKVIFSLVAIAVCFATSCKKSEEKPAEPEIAKEEALTAVDSVNVDLMSSCFGGAICEIISWNSEKMEVKVYKVAEKDGKVDVYTDIELKLDSVLVTPGFNANAKPNMNFSALINDHFVDVAQLDITDASKKNFVTFVTTGKKGDVTTVRFKGSVTAEDYAKFSQRCSVNYLGFSLEEPAEATAEDEENK